LRRESTFLETFYRFIRFLAYVSSMEVWITPRRRVLKAGPIELGGGAVDCTLRNISNTGAALDGTRPVGIPQFTLIVSADSHTSPATWSGAKRIEWYPIEPPRSTQL
jgi:hypothetical protein